MSASALNASELDRLQEINAHFGSITDQQSLCHAIVDGIAELTDLDDCVVYTRLGNVLTQMAALGVKSGEDGSIVERIGLPIGVGIVGSVALTREPVYVPDVSADPRYIEDQYTGASEFAVPIVHRGEIIGVLDSENSNIDGFSEKDRQIMTSLAVLAAPHIGALLPNVEGHSADYGEVIADLANLPQSNLRTFYANITERAARTLRSTRANIWLFNDERTAIQCVDHYDLRSQNHEDGFVLERASYPNYFAALQDERVILANDATTDARTIEFAAAYLKDNDIQAMLDAPIRQEGEVVGVLCIENTGTTRVWTNEEASFVATLADFITIALISDKKALVESALIQSQKMESLGRLAGGIAHDFNNLMTVISGAAETLQIKVTEPDQSTERLLSLILDARDRAARLTRNLLAYGGNQHLNLEACSTLALAENIRQLTENLVREEIELSFTTPEEDHWVRGDLTQLEQVLLNLILNGVDAISERGRIDVSFSREGNESVMRISDDGSGMDDEVRQRIFDPFFTTKGDLGTGLGLSVCQGIVSQHQGTLTCESQLGVGTTFEIRLSLVSSPDSAEEIAETPSPLETLPDSRILLVEDEPGVRDVVKQMLDALGFDPIVAEDARHALEILRNEDVQLMISDVVMPDMRGPDLYQTALEIRPDLTALFISGYTEDVIREVPTANSKTGYLSKPFTLDQLSQAFNQLLQ